MAFPNLVDVIPGEVLASYAPRLAEANLTTVKAVEQSERRKGNLVSYSPGSAQREQLWTRLAGIPSASFRLPRSLDGEAITERTFCTKCTKGVSGFGLSPDTGWVCVDHQTWLGDTQEPVSCDEVVEAEGRFRKKLAKRKLLHDSKIMRLALECAAVSVDKDAASNRRQQDAKLGKWRLDLYPETVEYAVEMTDSENVRTALSTIESSGNLVADVSDVLVSKVLNRTKGHSENGDGEPWRASARIAQYFRELHGNYTLALDFEEIYDESEVAAMRRCAYRDIYNSLRFAFQAFRANPLGRR